ncbi:CHAT domain-containing protein [Streptomyces sp. YIM S03343]
MAGPGWTQLRDAGAFETLGELFPDAVGAHAFLEDLGVNPALLPVFAPPLPAASWWRSVCRIVDQGRFAGVTLGVLVGGAAALYPGNPAFRELGGQARLRVLCLMAAPLDEARLRLGAEQRVLAEAAARSGGRLAVTVHPATRVGDIQPRLEAVRPQILHVAGHGTDDGRLLFEDETGISVPVPVQALAGALRPYAPLRCVVLNSCWSAGYADGLLDRADEVVGTAGELPDEAALLFTEGFYGSLAHSPSVARACDAARAAMELRGHSPAGVRRVSRTEHLV